MKRREFITKTAASSAALASMKMWELFTSPECLAASVTPGTGGSVLPRGGGLDVEEAVEMLDMGKQNNTMPEIIPEIRSNPKAVFLIKTHVSGSPNNQGYFEDARPQMEETGKTVARMIFRKGTKTGGSTLIKPNFTFIPDEVWSPAVGVITSPDFISGFVESLWDMSNLNVVVSERGGGIRSHRGTGIYDVFDQKNIPLIQASYANFKYYRKNELNWHKVRAKDPVVWKNIPTYRPIGDKDNLYINMPKLKCHNLGLTTLATKNIQGAIPHGYGQFCTDWEAIPITADAANIDFRRDFVRDYQQRVEDGFLRHRAAGFKHWDVEGSYPKYEAKGGWDTFKKIRNEPKAVGEFMDGIRNLMWDELWCQRTLDASTAVRPDINIIEGIIGRDGSGFALGTDKLMNIIVVGLSTIEVDAVGTYIMGHDPKEIFYTRIARERGLGEIDPGRIDIYWLDKDGIVPLRNLSEVPRYRLGVNIHSWNETGERLFW